jgi:hypothetical protein
VSVYAELRMLNAYLMLEIWRPDRPDRVHRGRILAAVSTEACTRRTTPSLPHHINQPCTESTVRAKLVPPNHDLDTESEKCAPYTFSRCGIDISVRSALESCSQYRRPERSSLCLSIVDRVCVLYPLEYMIQQVLEISFTNSSTRIAPQ